MADGDITQDQFIEMELDDGRLEDGTSVLTLFVNDDYAELLDIGVDNPLDIGRPTARCSLSWP